MAKSTKAILVALSIVLVVTVVWAQSQNFYTVGVRNKLTLLAATTYVDASVAGSYFKVNIAIGTIDSFTTTALLDSVYMPGASVGDVLLITPYTPAWSATPDTNMHYYAYVLNTDTAVAGRQKNSADADAKSAGLFSLAKLDK